MTIKECAALASAKATEKVLSEIEYFVYFGHFEQPFATCFAHFWGGEYDGVKFDVVSDGSIKVYGYKIKEGK